ncbi:MAG: VTT domain-containing protein [Blastocatellia bacterium]|nr:VTT domain-containing protein [Blastocatellia bacterium]
MPLSALFLVGIKQKITAWITAMTTWLLSFGIFGIFAVTLLDGAAVPTAGACDAALVLFAMNSPEKWWIFAVAAAVGSTIGSLMLYSMVQRAGERFLAKIKPEKRQRIENLLGRFDVLTLIVASLLPPPFPFKPFIICASALKIQKLRFTIGLMIGRTLRYGIFSYLAMRYGPAATEIIKHNSLWVFAGAGVLAIVIWLVQRNATSKKELPVVESLQPETGSELRVEG